MKNVACAAAAAKSNPKPTRFDPSEIDFLTDASAQTGLSISEIIRRSVRLCRRQKQLGDSYAFLVSLPH